MGKVDIRVLIWPDERLDSPEVEIVAKIAAITGGEVIPATFTPDSAKGQP